MIHRHFGPGATLGLMANAFWPGGSEDLQRNPRWGIPPESFVPAYTSAASDHFGYITAAAGLPRVLAEGGGGAHNLYSWTAEKAHGLLNGTGGSPSIDTNGKFGLSTTNEANIAQGYAAGLEAGKPPAPFKDYGYNAQAPQTPGQIGDGRGISPFSAGLAGINPDEPTPPDWPPQQNSQVRYLSSQRVRY
jgi:hypothetical protein